VYLKFSMCLSVQNSKTNSLNILRKSINYPKSSIVEKLTYIQDERKLTVSFKKGKSKLSNQSRELSDISPEIHSTILESQSVGKAILEILGERRYIKSQKKKKNIFSRIFSF